MLKVATNIFNSPPNTGPGNFGRRLAIALESMDVMMRPSHILPSPDLFLGSAFLDGYYGNAKATILRIDGAGHLPEQRRVKEAHKAATIVIYQSKYSKNALQDFHNYMAPKSYIIHNGVELLPYQSGGYGASRFISICNTWNKFRYINFLHGIYCNLPSIVSALPEFKWTIVGKYQEFKEAMNHCLCTSSDLVEKHIEFVEFTPKLSQLRAKSTACIHLVQQDSCPNSVIESLAEGLPCIVWRESAGPELIDEDKGGITLNTFDSLEVVKAITDINNRALWFAANARHIAEEKLDIHIVAQQYKQVFEDAMA